MAVKIPPGYGVAAWHLSAAFGTPDFVTTMGVDLRPAGGDFQAAANRCFDAYANALMPQTLSEYTLLRCTLTVGQDGVGVGSVDSNLSAVTGSRSGVPEAAAMSVIARKVTADLGRRGRGRMFLPGLLADRDVQPSGELILDVRGAFQTAFDALLVNLGVEGDDLDLGGPVLLHGEGPSLPTPITSLVLTPKVGWIRGRIR